MERGTLYTPPALKQRRAFFMCWNRGFDSVFKQIIRRVPKQPRNFVCCSQSRVGSWQGFQTIFNVNLQCIQSTLLLKQIHPYL